MRATVRHAVIAGLLLGLGAHDGSAQAPSDEAWNPFKPWSDPHQPRRKRPASPADAKAQTGKTPADRASLQRGPRNRPVESSDLPPLMAPDTSGLPLDLWRGLDMAGIEQLVAALDLPPRSPALHQLWRRMLLSSTPPPAGTPSADDFLVLRLNALYRSGLLGDMAEMLEKSDPSDSVGQVWRARVHIGLGAREAGCQAIKMQPPSSSLAGRLRGEAQLLVGYCAAAAGDAAAAGLAATIAREEGLAADFALTVLSSLDVGAGRLPLPERVSIVDYRLLELTGPVDGAQIVQKAEPALLVALAGSSASADLRLRTAAAEAALRLNALAPEAVAEIYRRQPGPAARATSAEGEQGDPMLHRARLFRAIEETQAPEPRARLVRTLLDEARRSGTQMQTARMLAPLVSPLWPSAETGVLAELIVEIALAAGDLDLARRWAETAANLQHWLALIDIADAPRRGGPQSGLTYMDGLAARGRLGADVLHRLATVLDALDISVPMGIREAAGRTPQPAAGYLPQTGVLAELAQASQRKEAGRTILVTLRALGANGAEGAHILALGDAVRALRQVGLEADARRLGVEALFAVWPRTSGH